MLLIIMVLIFGFSNQPTEESNRLSNVVGTAVNITPQHEWQDQSTTPIVLGLNIRKLAHIGLYFLMGFAAMGVFSKWHKALGICYAYAVIDEFHQYIVGRNACIEDTVLDGLGICSAIVVYIIVDNIIKIFKHK